MITQTTLKNAARAIGYDLWSDQDGSHYLVDYDGVKLKRWEPEHSSADSFELMVCLNITLDAFDRYNQIYAESVNMETMTIPYTENRSQDYRNSILLVAASIGAALCQS